MEKDHLGDPKHTWKDRKDLKEKVFFVEEPVTSITI